MTGFSSKHSRDSKKSSRPSSEGLSHFFFGRLWVLASALCIHILAHTAHAAPSVTPPAEPLGEHIRHDGRVFAIYGEPQLIYSASFPYYACPRELWAKRFRQIREAGFNAVETRVPWNWHERSAPSAPGDYAAMDLSSLTEWLRMAHEDFGLHTILRPGPGDVRGWLMGGWPAWLRAFPPYDHSAQSEGVEPTDPQRWVRHWYRAFARAVGPEQITRKEPGQAGVILIGVDADPSAKQPVQDLIARSESLREFGIEVPLFTTMPWPWDKVAPSSLPKMIIPGAPGSPIFAESVDVSSLPSESPADADGRVRAKLQEIFRSGAAWVNVDGFVASTPPPGWQNPAMDESAPSAPIDPDGYLHAAYYAAHSTGRWLDRHAAEIRSGKAPEDDSTSSVPPQVAESAPLPAPIAIESIQIRLDDPARADWKAWNRDEAPLMIHPGTRYSLFRILGPRPPGTTNVTLECHSQDVLTAWKNGKRMMEKPEAPAASMKNESHMRKVDLPVRPRDLRNALSVLLLYTDRQSTGSASDLNSTWGLNSDARMEWAAELAGIRERWYAPGISGEEWKDLRSDNDGWVVRSPSTACYALWMRADFKTPDAGFQKDVSWSALFQMKAGCAGGIAYLNGQPLRTLPESAGEVRLLLPARYLHSEAGTRNTLTLLLIPSAHEPKPGILLDHLRVEPYRRITGAGARPEVQIARP